MLYLWSFRQNLNNNIKQIIMKKIFETPARGGQTYESPKLETLDLSIEGVICASGAMGIREWDEETEDLGF